MLLIQVRNACNRFLLSSGPDPNHKRVTVGTGHPRGIEGTSSGLLYLFDFDHTHSLIIISGTFSKITKQNKKLLMLESTKILKKKVKY